MSANEYFGSYDNMQVHALMLMDKPRIEAYQRAIEANKELFKDKVVMDVGAGTGILSLMSARAGARLVFAVEASAVASVTADMAHRNGYGDVIKVIKSPVESITKLNDLQGNPTQVDILVSEWMGFYLLHESMLASVLHARDKFLREGGLILPSSADIHLSLVDLFGPLKNVGGFDMYDIRGSIQPVDDSTDVRILDIPVNTHVESTRVLSLDFDSMAIEDVKRFTSTVILDSHDEFTADGFGIWFDVFFRHADGDIVLSTAPTAPSTHWKQCMIPLSNPLRVPTGLRLTLAFECQQSSENHRHYNIGVTVLDANMTE
eukprot:GHVO01043974.1.p1 GENE.GHVO01043974.1~~GHVO01043974.1.p1  ORF type:complete len:318 (+),score=58.81 GHVO01043974.1:37-990(+)